MNQHFLTSRELEIFNLLIANETTKSIANKLSISDKTVRNQISNLIGKLGGQYSQDIANKLKDILLETTELIKSQSLNQWDINTQH